MKIILMKCIAILLVSISTYAQNINFNDINFKNALLDHGVGITGSGISIIDQNGDGEIQESEAQNYSGIINVASQSISDLSGIEEFIGITELKCFNNTLSSLNLSANINLVRIKCYNNQLVDLDVSQLSDLLFIECGNNQLTSIDVSTNPNLKQLKFHVNQVSTIDVTNNPQLNILHCGGNQISSLDLSQNFFLRELDCYDNNLNTLDVSSNVYLEVLVCVNNSISVMDLSMNPDIITFRAENNSLTELNVANGNNGNNFSNMNATNNPNLNCIQHDVNFDPTSAPNWTKDATAIWSDNCISSSLSISQKFMNPIEIFPNPAQTNIEISGVEIEKVQLFNLQGEQVLVGESNIIALENMATGMYQLVITDVNGNIYAEKIIKN